ncbi:hypothetical protein [Allokutzneria albata]|uniref:PE family protein n=1 Tax=Allokutzneria albata TaxID=211114 RepID=A0A1G9X2I6_ALLAB|nr:hypothetical protein [Allokutzneria albata]SDM90907.1 hypothetical protein SAMN04489726_3951 [Allokutzneria albata]
MSKQYARAGGWRIDLDKVPAAIKIFNDALDELSELTNDVGYAQEIRPMGDDHVSRTLADEVSSRHLGGSRGTIWAAAALEGELTKAIRSLENARRNYRRAEDANRHTVFGG